MDKWWCCVPAAHKSRHLRSRQSYSLSRIKKSRRASACERRARAKLPHAEVGARVKKKTYAVQKKGGKTKGEKPAAGSTRSINLSRNFRSRMLSAGRAPIGFPRGPDSPSPPAPSSGCDDKRLWCRGGSSTMADFANACACIARAHEYVRRILRAPIGI